MWALKKILDVFLRLVFVIVSYHDHLVTTIDQRRDPGQRHCWVELNFIRILLCQPASDEWALSRLRTGMVGCRGDFLTNARVAFTFAEPIVVGTYILKVSDAALRKLSLHGKSPEDLLLLNILSTIEMLFLHLEWPIVVWFVSFFMRLFICSQWGCGQWNFP